MELDGLQGDTEIGVDACRVYNLGGGDLEFFTAFGRKLDETLTFEANQTFTSLYGDLFDRCSIFIGKNQGGRTDGVNLKARQLKFLNLSPDIRSDEKYTMIPKKYMWG